MGPEPSDLTGTTIDYHGRRLRIVGHENNPRATRENRDAKPVYLVVDADVPRQPPYESWEQLLISDVLTHLAETREGNGRVLDELSHETN